MRATRVHALRTAERPHPGRKHGGNFQAKDDRHRGRANRKMKRFWNRKAKTPADEMYSKSGGD